MMKKLMAFLALLVFTSYAVVAQEGTSQKDMSQKGTSKKEQHTFVIVHGATGGGWDWKIVGQHLTDNGHIVYRPTLTGLGEKYHLANPDINLTTHIDDVVNTIIFEKLQNVVLVGHSYGGVVITGVMDRIPERIQHVTFLDAKVPEDGMPMAQKQKIPANFKIINGQLHFPWIDETAPFPRDVPQSLNTFTEPVSYKNPLAKKLDVTYVAHLPPGVSKKDRAKDPSWGIAEKRNWTIRTFDGDHVVYRVKPAEYAAMLEETVGDRNKQ